MKADAHHGGSCTQTPGLLQVLLFEGASCVAADPAVEQIEEGTCAGLMHVCRADGPVVKHAASELMVLRPNTWSW